MPLTCHSCWEVAFTNMQPLGTQRTATPAPCAPEQVGWASLCFLIFKMRDWGRGVRPCGIVGKATLCKPGIQSRGPALEAGGCHSHPWKLTSPSTQCAVSAQ